MIYRTECRHDQVIKILQSTSFENGSIDVYHMTHTHTYNIYTRHIYIYIYIYICMYVLGYLVSVGLALLICFSSERNLNSFNEFRSAEMERFLSSLESRKSSISSNIPIPSACSLSLTVVVCREERGGALRPEHRHTVDAFVELFRLVDRIVHGRSTYTEHTGQTVSPGWEVSGTSGSIVLTRLLLCQIVIKTDARGRLSAYRTMTGLATKTVACSRNDPENSSHTPSHYTLHTAIYGALQTECTTVDSLPDTDCRPKSMLCEANECGCWSFGVSTFHANY